MADGACSTRGPSLATPMRALAPTGRARGTLSSLSHARTGGGHRPRYLHERRGDRGEREAPRPVEPDRALPHAVAGGLHDRRRPGGGRGGSAPGGDQTVGRRRGDEAIHRTALEPEAGPGGALAGRVPAGGGPER